MIGRGLFMKKAQRRDEQICRAGFFVYINLLQELQINSVMDTFFSSLYIYFK
ncbi:hypothetical protein Hanom_Chr12g01115451 [Helianthus anomalus]